jgi:hypothetical protein
MKIKNILIGIVLFCANALADQNAILQAGHGPLSAFLAPENSIVINYYQEGHGRLSLCNNSIPSDNVFVMFITGPTNQRKIIEKKLKVQCTSNYPGNPHNASFSFLKTDDPELWDALFPKNEQGHRWYALQVAFFKKSTATRIDWDSNLGNNYKFIFK